MTCAIAAEKETVAPAEACVAVPDRVVTNRALLGGAAFAAPDAEVVPALDGAAVAALDGEAVFAPDAPLEAPVPAVLGRAAN